MTFSNPQGHSLGILRSTHLGGIRPLRSAWERARSEGVPLSSENVHRELSISPGSQRRVVSMRDRLAERNGHDVGLPIDASLPLALSTSGLTKSYGTRTAVSELDLAIPQGVISGFVGPNGAGKTTTIRMLLGLIAPTAGSGEVLGVDLGQPQHFLQRVGAMIESPAFYPALSGQRNLEVLARLGGIPHVSIGRALRIVDLADRAGDPFRSYSLGMKQRLGIAAALLPNPDLLILDEPTNGLDPAGIAEMRVLFAYPCRRGHHHLRLEPPAFRDCPDLPTPGGDQFRTHGLPRTDRRPHEPHPTSAPSNP